MQTTLVLTFVQDVTRTFIESLTQDQIRPGCLHIELRRSYAQHMLFHTNALRKLRVLTLR